MQSINPNPFDYIFAGNGTPAPTDRYGRALRAFWLRSRDRLRAIQEMRRLRDQYDSLMTMPDHQLRDIGLNPSQSRRDGFKGYVDTRLGPV